MFVFLNKTFLKKSKQQGFSLVELLIVVAIITTLSTISVSGFMSNQERVGNEEDVTKILFGIREAQINARGVRETSLGSEDFSGIYSVVINRNDRTIRSYAVKDEEGAVYTNNSDLVFLWEKNLNGRINQIRSEDSPAQINELHIVFNKDHSSSEFFRRVGPHLNKLDTGYIKILVKSSRGNISHTVCVYSVGFSSTFLGDKDCP